MKDKVQIRNLKKPKKNKKINNSNNNWVILLSTAEFAYNSRVHVSIGMSPFEADLGYCPRGVAEHVFDKIVGTKSKSDIFILGQRQQVVLEKLKESLLSAQSRMKLYYDRNRPIQEFNIGDQVLISSKNLNVEHLGIIKSGTTKFGPLWIGPYPVIKKTSIDTYRLQIPIGLKLHPEFHTSLLKPYTKDSDSKRMNKPNEGMVSTGGYNDSFLIEKIIGHKLIKKKIYYRVKWLGYTADYDTWEPYLNIYKPAANLINVYLDEHRLEKIVWNPKFR